MSAMVLPVEPLQFVMLPHGDGMVDGEQEAQQVEGPDSHVCSGEATAKQDPWKADAIAGQFGLQPCGYGEQPASVVHDWHKRSDRQGHRRGHTHNEDLRQHLAGHEEQVR